MPCWELGAGLPMVEPAALYRVRPPGRTVASSGTPRDPGLTDQFGQS